MKQITQENYDRAVDLMDELIRIFLSGEADDGYPYKVSEDLMLAVELLAEGEERKLYRIHKGTTSY